MELRPRTRHCCSPPSGTRSAPQWPVPAATTESVTPGTPRWSGREPSQKSVREGCCPNGRGGGLHCDGDLPAAEFASRSPALWRRWAAPSLHACISRLIWHRPRRALPVFANTVRRERLRHRGSRRGQRAKLAASVCSPIRGGAATVAGTSHRVAEYRPLSAIRSADRRASMSRESIRLGGRHRGRRRGDRQGVRVQEGRTRPPDRRGFRGGAGRGAADDRAGGLHPLRADRPDRLRAHLPGRGRRRERRRPMRSWCGRWRSRSWPGSAIS